MSFTVPQFPLKCAVWHNWTAGVSTYAVPDVVHLPCNLAPGRRNAAYVGHATAGLAFALEDMFLLLPAGSNIRMQLFGASSQVPDWIECPEGSKVFYQVEYVDDFGKGFPNEHRFVVMNRWVTDATFSDGVFPVVVPFP